MEWISGTIFFGRRGNFSPSSKMMMMMTLMMMIFSTQTRMNQEFSLLEEKWHQKKFKLPSDDDSSSREDETLQTKIILRILFSSLTSSLHQYIYFHRPESAASWEHFLMSSLWVWSLIYYTTYSAVKTTAVPMLSWV